MAELTKLNNIGRAKSKHQLDMEAMERGAAQSGTLIAPAAPAPKAAPVDNVPMGEMQDIEDDVAAKQKANLANPGVQDKLNAVAKARAKFYGEGT
jgi:hypothetical protein